MKNRKVFWASCILLWCFWQQTALGKIFDESQAVPYETFRASHTVEDATLFIGTYLIHVRGLTDELYEKAQESASDSNQMNVYYKSELAGGAWMDITDAVGLSDLAGEGTVVEESELFPLWVTCYTGADGITRDARDDHVVNIFSEPSPYDLYNLAELEPIKIQYSNAFSAESKGVDRYYYEKLRDFFSLDLQNEITQECDMQLAGLQSCYESLRAQGKDELAEIVSTLMGRIDSRRRAEIFYRLSQMDGNELSVLQDICGGSQYYGEDETEEEGEEGEEDEEDGNGEEDGDDEDKDEEASYGYDDEQFVENNSVIEAIGTAIENCQESYIKHSGNMLEEGDTVLKNAEHAKSMAVVGMAPQGFGGGMEELLLELKTLYHLEEDVVADADAELALLEGELIAQADAKYAQKLTEGACSAYQTAVAGGSSQSARNQVLEDQKAKTDAARLELQYLLQAKTKRQPAGQAVEFSYQRIGHAETLYGQLRADDYRSKASESIDAHILWLKSLARSLEEGDEASSDMEKLEEEKARLLEEQAGARDRNDLSTAKKYEAMIAQVDREIQAEEQRLLAILSSASGSAAQKARAANQAGSSSVLNRIGQIKDAALLEIAEGNKDNQESIISKLDALSALGAESAIAEIQEKLRASDNDFREAEKAAEQAILDSRESSLHGRYGGGEASGAGGGTGAGTGTGAGSGSGTGTGSGDGTGTGAGTGTGSGAGTGSGDGTGTGNESGTGGGSGAGTGNGPGTGSGNGTGTGSGSGTGNESGTGTGTGAGTESGNGSGTGGLEGEIPGISALDAQALEALIEEALGAPFEELDDSRKAAAVAALDRMGQAGNQTAAQMALTWLNACVSEKNKYVFQKLKGEAGEHLALDTVASCTGYRYVYSDSRMEVTLSKKLSVYRFRVNQDQVQLLDDITEKLEGAVKLQGDHPYLLEADARQYFNCEAEYIHGTEYGICLGPKEEGFVESIMEALREGGW
nr:hypothetical protein [uncultured Acetatifactor sp.]